MEPSVSIQIPQAQNSGYDEQQSDSKLDFFQCRCFGRSVSFLTGDVVSFVAGSFAGVAVSLTAGITVGIAVGGTTVAGAATGIGVSILTGSVAAVSAGATARCLYAKYQHVAPTDTPIALARVTDHDSQVINETTPLPTVQSVTTVSMDVHADESGECANPPTTDLVTP